MRITVVVPVYCEEKGISPLFRRLESVASFYPAVQWDYVFVNDGSRDGTLNSLRDLSSRNPNVKVLDLTRNFGKEIALSAGVDVADGDAVICMDADLQHPPELISDMIEAWRRGAEVVVAVRLSIARQPLLRRMGSYLFHQLMTRFSGIDMTLGATDYRLLDRKVVRVFRNITERARMFRGIVDWMGFETERVYFHADFRREGKSSFSYGRLWQMAVTSLTSFSLVPLRLTAYLGLAITTGSGLLLARMFWARLFPGATIFTPLAIFVVANTFLMGIVLMAVGMVAFYIGTIHTEVVNRPLYIVRNRINFSGSRAAERVESVASERDA